MAFSRSLSYTLTAISFNLLHPFVSYGTAPSPAWRVEFESVHGYLNPPKPEYYAKQQGLARKKLARFHECLY